ncbi:MAG TPA: lipoprotein [Candidatus Binatia bacterium]|nr:lipoprotein [Candidatus Binatia bacterium]
MDFAVRSTSAFRVESSFRGRPAVRAALLLFLLLTACGQAGDLYLPDRKPAAAPAQPSVPAPATSTDTGTGATPAAQPPASDAGQQKQEQRKNATPAGGATQP